MKKKTVFLSFGFLLLGFLVTSEYAGKLLGVTVIDQIYYPFVWSLVFLPSSLLALTLTDQKHKFWLKFSGIFFIVSMFIVFLMPEYGTGIVSIDRELTNWFFLGLYSFISLIYFIVQFFKNRRQV